MPGMTANCLSGLGNRSKNFTRSAKLAMPSYWPRMMRVGAVADGRVVVAGLGGAAVALHVHAPGGVAAPREEIHRRGVGAPRHLQVEGRLRGHGRAVHEQDSAGGARRIAGVLVPQEQTDIAALLGPVLLAAHDGGGRNGLVHYATPRS